MSSGTLRREAVVRLAWTHWVLCVVMIVAGLALLVGARDATLPPEANPWGAKMVDLATIVVYPTVAVLILVRRPRNILGWLFCAASLAGVFTSFADAYAIYSLRADPGSLPYGGTMAWAAEVSWRVGVGLAPFLFLLFPDGRLPSRAWRPLVPLLVVGYGLAVLVTALAPGPVYESLAPENQFAVGGVWGGVLRALDEASGWGLLGVMLLTAYSALLRFRRSGGDERQQLKWVGGAIALLTVVLISTSILNAPRSWESLVEFPAFLAPPVAVGVAMLKHRLYDVDLIINRTIVYISLTAVLAACYLGGVTLLQQAFRSLTGQGSQLAVVASTLAIAALFRPLRGSIQDFVDRRFYRRKYDAEKTLAAFSLRLRAGVDLDALGGGLVDMVTETIQPEHVSLWLKDATSNGGGANVPGDTKMQESSARNVFRNG